MPYRTLAELPQKTKCKLFEIKKLDKWQRFWNRILNRPPCYKKVWFLVYKEGKTYSSPLVPCFLREAYCECEAGYKFGRKLKGCPKGYDPSKFFTRW